MKGRYRQLVRVLRLIRVLESSRRVHLDTLASQLRVCRRTIRRDLAALSAAGYAIPQAIRERDITN